MSGPPSDHAPRNKGGKRKAPPNVSQRAVPAQQVADIDQAMFEGAVDGPEPVGSPTSHGTATPRLSSDIDHGEDCLGVRDEARAFARIICSRQTNTPLSVGLFGDWGSGKSFFMDLVKRNVASRCEAFTAAVEQEPERAEPLGERWHGRIAQITFNAWHYAEPNLWASLVTRIFDELSEQLNPEQTEESIEDTRNRLLAEVSDGKERRQQTKLELRMAEEQLASARAEQEQCEGRLTQLREELAVVEVIAPEPEPGAEPGAEPADAEPADAEPADAKPADAKPAAPPPLRVATPWAALRVTMRWVWARGRWTRVALVAGLVLLVLGGLLALAWWRQWLDLSAEIAMAVSVGGVLMTVFSTVSAWVVLIKPKLTAAVKAHKALAEGKDRAGRFVSKAIGDLLRSDENAVRLARRRVEAAEIELDSANAAAEQAAAQMARARRQLQQLDGGHRFYDFVMERDESDEYRRHLGLVSLIRKDFERLEKILDQVEREGPGKDAPAPISRVVLYIDDLDRCDPERVVEVLQAVHLLLATPIFVVVVAVDVRWLRRSLTLHYDRLLHTPQPGAHASGDESRPTPKNYLEKIFQIPFSLRPMGAEGFTALVRNLVADDLPNDDEPDESAELDLGEPDEPLDDDVTLQLHPDEVDFMQTLHRVIDTPRLAKALVNTYRLLRAELPPEELSSYLAQQEYRGVLLLLAIQVGRSREAAVLFDQLSRQTKPTLRTLVHHLGEQRQGPDRWEELHAALEQVDPEDHAVHQLLPWLDRIRRFSFNPWPTG